MYKYILISRKTEGFIAYGFDRHGLLREFRLCCPKLTPDHVQAVLLQMGHMLSYAMLRQWAAEKGHIVVRVDVDLSFDMFWLVYDMARDRHKAMPIWQKMNAEDRTHALWSHEAYMRYLARYPKISKMYGVTFLKDGRFTDWDKVEHLKKENR